MFKALSDPVRISIVASLAGRTTPATVTTIAEGCGVDFSGVSRHLKLLKEAGILLSKREGRKMLYWLDGPSLSTNLRGVADALDMCCAQAGTPNTSNT